jgi:hypothetical protein
MARFTKNNNPNRRKRRKYADRTTADITAAKMSLDDSARGVDLPLSFYDHISDKMSGKPSRNIYE